MQACMHAIEQQHLNTLHAVEHACMHACMHAIQLTTCMHAIQLHACMHAVQNLLHACNTKLTACMQYTCSTQGWCSTLACMHIQTICMHACN